MEVKMSRRKIKKHTGKRTPKPRGDRSVSPRAAMQTMARERRKRAAVNELLESMRAAGADAEGDGEQTAPASAADLVGKMREHVEGDEDGSPNLEGAGHA
jgi:hypothetical protein